jgi:hypothetical protein
MNGVMVMVLEGEFVTPFTREPLLMTAAQNLRRFGSSACDVLQTCSSSVLQSLYNNIEHTGVV